MIETFPPTVVDQILGEPQLMGELSSGFVAPMANLVTRSQLLRKVQEKVSPSFTAHVFLGENELFSAAFQGRSLKQESTKIDAAKLITGSGSALAFDVLKLGALIETPQNVWFKTGPNPNNCVGQTSSDLLDYYQIAEVVPPSALVGATVVKDP